MKKFTPTTEEQQNIVKFLTGSKKSKMIVKTIIKDAILFDRACNSLNLVHTVLSGKERGCGFEFECNYSGMNTVCKIIGIADETAYNLCDLFQEVSSKDFFSNPTERKPVDEEAKMFYKQLKSFLRNELNKPSETENTNPQAA